MSKILRWLALAAFIAVGLPIKDAQAAFKITRPSGDSKQQAFASVQSNEAFDGEAVEAVTKAEPFIVDFAKLGVANPEDAYLLIVNEKNGNMVSLSAGDADSSKLELSPLALAELELQYLGANQKYRAITMCSSSSGKDEVVESRLVGSALGTVKLPQFYYRASDGSVKLTTSGERQLVGLSKDAPNLIMRDPNDAAQAAFAESFAEKHSYLTYLYQLPDGSKLVFSEETCPQESDGTPNFVESNGNNISFELTWSGPSEAKNATAYGLVRWCNVLSGTIPIKISIKMFSFSANPDYGPEYKNVIGCSWSPPVVIDIQNHWAYVEALGQQLAGQNFSQTYDIRLEMNTDMPFYYGTDEKASSSQIDYVTIVLHEVTHGLGFMSSILSSGSLTYNDGEYWYPMIYDYYLTYGGVSLCNMSQSERYNAIRSDALYFSGPKAMAANGGKPIKMYAPPVYESGSSISHWDTSVTFKTFMKPYYQYPCHTIGERELGLLQDIGWSLPAPKPTLPPAPTGVTATKGTQVGKVAVSWNASSGATSYNVYRAQSPSGTYSVLKSGVTGLSYSDTSVSGTSTYYYKVAGVNSAGTGALSSYDYGYAKEPTTLKSIAISGPATLNAEASGDYSLTATYSDGSTATVTTNATWSLATGSAYASLSGHRVTAGAVTGTSRNVTLRASFGGKTTDYNITVLPKTVTVTFDAGTYGTASYTSKSYTVDAAYGSLPTVTILSSYANKYEFTGWYTAASGGSKVAETTLASGSVTKLYAHYTPVRVLESLRLDGPTQVTCGSSVFVKCYAKYSTDSNEKQIVPGRYSINSTGSGLSYLITTGVVSVAATTTANGSMTITAYEESKSASITVSAYMPTVTVIFDPQGGTVSPTSKVYNVGVSYGSLPMPSRTAYSFEGWYTAANGGTKVTVDTICLSNITKLYARWVYNPTLTGIAISGPDKVTSGGTGAYICTATYNDNKQEGVSASWSTTKGSISSSGVLTAPGVTSETTLTITATYTSKGVTKTATKVVTVTPKSVTVSFDAGDGATAQFTSRSYTVGAQYGTLPTASKSGNWNFLGWFTSKGTDGQKVDVSTIVSESVTKLYAQWQERIVMDKLAINGSTSVTSEGMATYTCTAYYSDGSQTNVVPVWSIKSGTAYASITANGVLTAAKTTANRSVVVGATFGGSSTTKSVTIVPKKVTVTFNANGGTVSPSTKEYTVGLAYGSFSVANWDAHRFVGWFTSASAGTQVTEDMIATESQKILYAHWQENPPALKEIIITGGASSVTACGSVSFVATAYYTNGITTTSENISGKASWSVSNDAAGTINAGTFTAKQVTATTATTITVAYEGMSKSTSITVNPEEVTVSFNANGGSVSPVSKKYIVGAAYGTLPTPSYDNDHTFEGWFTDAKEGRPITEASICERSLTTLYAHWKERVRVVSVAIYGENVVTGGIESVYTCKATYSDGTENIVKDAVWTISDARLGEISEGGVLTAANVIEETELTVYASYDGKSANLVVTIMPTIISVRFDPQNGAVSPPRMNFVVGDVYGDLPVPVRSGYIFDGWWTGESKSGTRVSAESIVDENVEVLYAGYLKETYELTGIKISGPEKVMSGGFAVYSCKALYANGSSGDVVPTWSLSSGLDYASMRGTGMLSALTTEVERSVTILATYYEAGIRYEDVFTVKIVPQMLAISPAMFSIEANAQSCELMISATGNWTVETDSDWITLGKTSGKSIDALTFTVSANTDTEERTGTITVRSGDIVETSIVKQYSPIPEEYVTVSFDPQVAGQSVSTRQYVLNRKFGYLPTPVREGYAFGGWWTGKGGTGTRCHSLTIVSNSKLKLYAYWTDMTVAYALNNSLDWVQDATKPWVCDYVEAMDRKVAMASPAIGNGEASELTALVEGPGTISFYWKTSSEEYFDTLALYVDGKFAASISGETGWQNKSHVIDGYGQHVLVWRYAKDGRNISGADCSWLDLVTWIPNYSGPGTTSIQSADGKSLPESWINAFGLMASPDIPNEDTDGDGMTNYEEYKAGTDPTDAESSFKVYLEMDAEGKPVIEVISGKPYILEGKENLDDDMWESANPDIHHFFRARIAE